MKIFPVIIILFFFAFLYSCSTISIKQRIDPKDEDWLVANSNPLKQNISKSNSQLIPPFIKLWDFYADAGFPANAMTLSDAVLFASTLRGEVYAVDVSSGKRLGNVSKFGGPTFAAPAIYKNNIIFTIDGNSNYSVVMYDITRGIYSWRYNAGFIRSSPVVNHDNIYVASKDGKVFCIDASSGIAEWIFVPTQPGPNSSAFFNSPVVDSERIFIGNTSGNFYCLKKSDGTLIWQKDFGDAFYCDASVYNGIIFTGCDDGMFRAISADGNTIWETELNTRFITSSTFHENNIITAGINGIVYALDINTGAILWEFETAGAITASPVRHKNLIFIGSFDKNFYCIDAFNGKELWRYETDGRVKTTALVWNEFIFAASEDRKIYCFK